MFPLNPPDLGSLLSSSSSNSATLPVPPWMSRWVAYQVLELTRSTTFTGGEATVIRLGLCGFIPDSSPTTGNFHHPYDVDVTLYALPEYVVVPVAPGRFREIRAARMAELRPPPSPTSKRKFRHPGEFDSSSDEDDGEDGGGG